MNTSELSDFDVIKECLKGDNSYFEEIVKRYKNLVYSIILRMVNDHEEANDLAQEVFIKLYKNLDKYYPDFKFSTWVIRITTNHVIDYRRKKKHDFVPLDSVESELSASESPESITLQKERKSILDKSVQELPDMYRIPIVLYHQQGLSYQEIADVIDEPLSKVKNRIFRGRKMLKDSLSYAEGGESYGL